MVMGISSSGFSSYGLVRNYATAKADYDSSVEKLSSGQRINRASDDSAGLALSESLKAQMNGNRQAVKNIQDGVSMLQVADSGLGSLSNIVNSARDILSKMQNGTISDATKKDFTSQLGDLVKQWDETVDGTKFNGKTLLGGDYENTGINIHVGANVGDNVSIKMSNMKMQNFLPEGFDVNSMSFDNEDDFKMASSVLDAMSEKVNSERSNVGANTNRLNTSMSFASTMAVNLDNAYHKVMDTDVVKETANMSAAQIRMMAAQSMLVHKLTNDENMINLLLR